MKLIDEDMLQEFRNKRHCELCGKVANVQPHHAFARGHGGGNRLDHPYNLISLCGFSISGLNHNNCHGKVHDGKISRQQILEIIAKREGMTTEKLLEELHAMMRASKGNKK